MGIAVKLIKISMVVGILGGAAGGAAEPDRPNVIVIIADDLGYADAAFQEVVADGVKTPNLERLVAAGVVFQHAYAASAVCSNSRLSLSTGRYAQRWGAYYYGEGGMPSTESTIAEMMLAAGYRTMKVGKTHMNNGPKADAMKHGFEQYLGFRHHSWDFHLISEKDVQAYNRKQPGSAKKAYMCPIGPMTRDHGKKESFENTTTTEVFGRESIKFIKQDSAKPFYLQLEFNAVHTPLTRAPNRELARKYGIPERLFERDAAVWAYPFWDPVAQPDFREWYDQATHLGVADPYGRKIYLAHLELMDSMIGEIMDALEARGLADNTIIFFSSDNGGSDQSYADNGNLNAYKYCLMDGGIKVPMVLSWPQKFRGNQRIDAMVTHLDLFATLSEITGVSPEKRLDGKSLLPLLEGKVNELHPEPVFWDMGKQRNWVVRQGAWKLVYRGKSKAYKSYELDENGLVKPKFRSVPIPAGLQLYHMTDDPGETLNLIEKYPEKAASMEKAYRAWRAQMAEPISGKKAR